ncbi:MAG: LURP-one-related family protein [Oscillospiraceae bacterium]
MRLLFKQRFFSWFDSYDIYNDSLETQYVVKGKLSFGHILEVYDSTGYHIATLKEKIFNFLPKFEIYINNVLVGEITKKLTFFKPSFTLNCNDWQVEGDFFEWDYQIISNGYKIAIIQKQLFNFTDTYTIDVFDDKDALITLMIVLAIDAVKCSQSN